MVIFVIVISLLGFVHSGEFNIDAVYFTRDNWNKQMIVGFTAEPVEMSNAGEIESEKLFSYPYPGFREGCDCRDLEKSMDKACRQSSFYGKIHVGKCNADMSFCKCEVVASSRKKTISNVYDLNDVYASRLNLDDYDSSYRNLFSKLTKDFKCPAAHTLYGALETQDKKTGVCIDNKVLTYFQPVSAVEISPG